MINNSFNIEYICYELYIKSDCSNEKINEYTNLLHLTFEKFIELAYSYIQKNVHIPEYVKILDKVLEIQSEEEVIKYLNSLPISLNFLLQNIQSYFICYRPNIYYLDIEKRESLKNKLRKYEIYLYQLDKPKTNANSLHENAIMTIYKFINSKFSKN